MARSSWVSMSMLRKVAQFLRELGMPPQAIDVSTTFVRFYIGNAVLTANSDDELERELAAFRKKHD